MTSRSSSTVNTVPVGLCGVHIISSRVRSVQAARIARTS